jgi:protein involved in polysaccharide export with SLBB domain
MFIFEIIRDLPHTGGLPKEKPMPKKVFPTRPLLLAALLTGFHAPAQVDRMNGLPVLPAQAVVPAAQAVPSATPETVVYTSSESLDDKRKLTIGDHISYRVLEDKNPAVSLMVTDAGDIEVPLLGRVSAAGKSCRQLAYEMKPVLEKTYFYKATVIVALDFATQKSPGRIYVTGMVGGPGPQDMPPDEIYTLSKAITKAGGVAQFGNDHRVKIVRKDADGTTENMEVDVGEIINKGRIDKDPVLQPNDMIVVPRKLINF